MRGLLLNGERGPGGVEERRGDREEMGGRGRGSEGPPITCLQPPPYEILNKTLAVTIIALWVEVLNSPKNETREQRVWERERTIVNLL